MRNRSVSQKISIAASQNTKERDYWLKKLSGNLVKSGFPYSSKDTPPGNDPGKVKFTFTGKLHRRLMELSNDSDARLHMIMVAGLTVLVSKYTYEGNRDVILGMPIYKQETGGEFINTILALRNQIEERMTFKELLLQVWQTVTQSIEHQNYPIETLLYKLNIPVSGEDFPLFDIIILLENIHDKRYIQHIKVKMVFSLSRTDQYIEGVVRYNSSYFHQTMVQRIVNHFKNLLEKALFHINLEIDDIDILSENEKKQLLMDFNHPVKQDGADLEFSQTRTINEWFAHQVEKKSHMIALTFEGRYLTYRELNLRANRLANLLIKKGVNYKAGKDTVIGVLMDRSLEMIIGILAVVKTGAAYLPIDTHYPEERILFMLNDCKVSFLLAQEKVLHSLSNYPQMNANGSEKRTMQKLLNREIVTLDMHPGELQHYPHENPAVLNQPDDLLYVIYTSGSTGRPKGVMLEHRNFINLLNHQYNYTNLDFSRILQFTAIGFDVSSQEIFSTLLYAHGGTLFLINKDTQHNLPRLFKLIDKNHIKTLFLPPSFLKFIFSERDYEAIFPRGIAHIVSAGEQLKVTPGLRRYLKENNVYLHNHYGPSESHVVTCLTIDPAGDIPGLPSIGKPVVNTGIYILNQQMRLQPVEAPGELYIGGAQVGRGYWAQEEMTAERFTPNPFKNNERLYRTGDMARWLPNGSIEFLGRADYQVKIRGFRVELGEIENQLLKHQHIKEAVVMANETGDGDRYLAAGIVSHRELADEDLRDYLAREFPDYMIPAHFLHLEEIPLTSNRKVDLEKLAAIEKEQISKGQTYTAPRNELEEKLAKIWSEVLNVKRIGIHDDFFNLGGHSLKILKLLNALEKELNVKVNFQEIFINPTISDQYRLIATKEKSRVVEIEKQSRRPHHELSYSQKRLWVIYKLDPQNPSFNMGGSHPLHEPVDEEVLKRVIETLVWRHESFRTRFKEIDGEPVQVIEDTNRVNLEIVDFSHLDGEGWEAALREYRWQETITPFCLEQAPLFRIKLLKWHDQHHELIFNMHHIITDGWSMEILEREFFLLLECFKKGEKSPLKPLKFQYKDYAAWQDKLLADREKMQETREFWANQLKGELPFLDLPYDYPRSAARENKESAAYRAVIPETLTRRLRVIAKNQKASLFMVLLAGFNVLLWQLSGQEDIIFAVPAAARQNEDLKNIIGFFVNTVIIRNLINPAHPFSLFLRNVQTNTMQVLEYQSYPLELLCSELKIKYPEISVFFNMSIFWDMNRQYLEDRQAHHTPQVQNAKFDIVCYIREYKNGIVINPHYFARLFKPETIEKIIQKYVKILENIANDPEQPIKYHIGSGKKQRIKLDQ